MYYFLIPLLSGFTFNLASAFTTEFSNRWGASRGSLITFIFRNILGIPVWSIGFIMAIIAQSPVFFTSVLWIKACGWFLIIFGGVVVIIALVTLRIRAAKPSVSDKIARSGLYNYIRHPIHSGTMLEFAGVFLLFPSLAVAIASGSGILWIIIQTKCEEYDLLQRMPEYQDYMSQVPCFFPHLLLK